MCEPGKLKNQERGEVLFSELFSKGKKVPLSLPLAVRASGLFREQGKTGVESRARVALTR
jgi:hypothetical protein